MIKDYHITTNDAAQHDLVKEAPVANEATKLEETRQYEKEIKERINLETIDEKVRWWQVHLNSSAKLKEYLGERQRVGQKILEVYGRQPMFQILPSTTGGPLGATSPSSSKILSRDSRNLCDYDQAVPVRIDLEVDGYKIRDSFLWPFTMDPESALVITPEEMADTICKDFDVPRAIFGPLIGRCIREAVVEYREFVQLLRSTTNGKDLFKPFKGIVGIVRLDIIIGLLQITDKLEWDLGETRNRPEQFAELYVRELALPLQFLPVIAFDIYEQVYQLRRALLLSGFSIEKSKDPIDENMEHYKLITHDPDLNGLVRLVKPSYSSSTPSIIRKDNSLISDFTPVITELDQLERDKIEQSRDREARRKRRQTRSRRAGGISYNAPSNLTSSLAGSGGATQESTSTMGLVGSGWNLQSPPRSMPTDLEYRGSLNRQLKRDNDDDEYGGSDSLFGAGAAGGALGDGRGLKKGASGLKRGRRGRKKMRDY